MNGRTGEAAGVRRFGPCRTRNGPDTALPVHCGMATTRAHAQPLGPRWALTPLLAWLMLVWLMLASLMLVSAPVAAQRVVSTRVTVNAFGTAVIGLIENDTAQSVEVMSLSVTLRDAGGNALARQSGVPDLRILAPGDRSPFTVPSFDPSRSASATAASVDLSVRSAEAPREDLAVRDVHAEPSTAGTRVTGTVVNLGDAPIDFIKVSATALGPNDAVLDTSVYYENLRTLAPGASMPFTVLLPGLLEEPTAWLVVAHDGRGTR